MSTAEIHFWIIATILVILILGFLLWPILNFKRNNSAPREAYDINVYKDQLIEIDTDLERGLLSLDQGEAARTEIKRRMLAAVDSSEDGAGAVLPSGGGSGQSESQSENQPQTESSAPQNCFHRIYYIFSDGRLDKTFCL